MEAATVPDLLEREREAAVLGAAVERAAAGEPALVLVEAEAGGGKSGLLRVAAALGEAAGLRVLRARGSELDRDVPFGLVRQLLALEVAADPGLLEGAGALAAPVFDPSAPGLSDAPESGSPEGLHWLAVALASRAPLALVADDLHWADAASLRWLVRLAERLDDLPALVVGATRPAEPGAEQRLLDLLLTAPSAHVLSPAPLSEAAAATLVRRRLPAAADAFCSECRRATGGNPFLLGQLVGELAAQGMDGTEPNVAQIVDFGPEGVARAVRRRLRPLPSPSATIAAAVAVLGAGATPDEIAKLASADLTEVAAAVDALARAGILAAAPGLDFVHPVVRASVLEQLPPLERQALHGRAAELLAAAGAPPERVARHLLRLPPAGDAGRVATLRAAARDATARGASREAVRHLARALEEPPDSGRRPDVLHELALAEVADGRLERFAQHFREALDATSDPGAKARIGYDLGRSLAATGDFAGAVKTFAAALRVDPEGELAVTLEGELLCMAPYDFTQTADTLPLRERRLAELERGEALDVFRTSAMLLTIAASRGPAAAAIALAEPVRAQARFGDMHCIRVCALGNGLLYAGALGAAAAAYDGHLELSHRRGNRVARAWQLTMRSEVSLRMAHVRPAEAEARAGHEFFAGAAGSAGHAWAAAHLLNVLVVRGTLDEADELAGEVAWMATGRPSLPVALLLVARARLHLARGRPTAALVDARAAGTLASPTIANPAVCAWRTPLALALHVLGRQEEARATAAEDLAAAERFQLADAEGAALRTLALVTGGTRGLALRRRSVAVLEDSENRLEHLRSLLELGSALRRGGERVEARDVLRDALDLATRAGATPLAGRAQDELVAAGARPRRDRRMLTGPESLTASEERVATLAAAGHTNREIAQRLYVTVKAVEFHLGNVYRKLDISSRAELPAALTREPSSASMRARAPRRCASRPSAPACRPTRSRSSPTR